MKTSLLISAYRNNTAEEVRLCFESIKTQKYVPSEIIFIIDGPVDNPVLLEVDKWSKNLPIKIHQLRENMGLAYALNYGLRLCAYDWVFRMDVDDVCANDRFFRQLNIIKANPDIDILGGNILCFELLSDPFPGRRVPTSGNAIRKFIKFRNPLNHPTVVFNKNKILDIGGYPDARLGQDYLLWINAVNHGLVIQNTDDVLVYMKVDKNLFSRRGVRNFRYDAYPYLLMYQNEMSNIFELIIGLAIRLVYCSYCTLRSTLRL